MIIIGIILYFPGSIGLQIVLPFLYGLVLSYLLGPGFFIAGIIFLIKDRNSPSSEKELIYRRVEICGKCGKEIPHKDSLCPNCGSKSNT